MRCAICRTDLGIKGRNPGGCLCSGCADEIAVPFAIEDWKLVATNIVENRIFECSFLIVPEYGQLVVQKAHIARPDQVLLEDFEVAKRDAVRAFIELGGVRPVRKPDWAARTCRPRSFSAC